MQLSDQPTWRQFLVMMIAVLLMLILGSVVLLGFDGALDTLKSNQSSGRDRGFATRAQACSNVILDDDRNFELTAACTAPEITAYYPTTICKQFFPDVAICGTKATDPAL